VSHIVEYGCGIGFRKIMKIKLGRIHFTTILNLNTNTDIHIDI
jgi:hypothetical protein